MFEARSALNFSYKKKKKLFCSFVPVLSFLLSNLLQAEEAGDGR